MKEFLKTPRRCRTLELERVSHSLHPADATTDHGKEQLRPFPSHISHLTSHVYACFGLAHDERTKASNIDVRYSYLGREVNVGCSAHASGSCMR